MPLRPPSAIKAIFSKTSAPFRTPANADCERAAARPSYSKRRGNAKVRL
jgi:hypothetical protein